MVNVTAPSNTSRDVISKERLKSLVSTTKKKSLRWHKYGLWRQNHDAYCWGKKTILQKENAVFNCKKYVCCDRNPRIVIFSLENTVSLEITLIVVDKIDKKKTF